MDRNLATASRHPDIGRRLMTIPGVGPVTSLAFIAMIDDPGRFRTSTALGANLGLTPRVEGDCGGLLFVERSWTADKRTVPKIKSQKAVRIPRNADPNALPDFAGPDFAGFAVTASEPQRAFSAKIEPIEPTINPQRRGEPSWSSRQVAQALDAAI